MTTEQYQKLYRWFMAHPRALLVFRVLYQRVSLLVVFAYLILLVRYGCDVFDTMSAGNLAGTAVKDFVAAVMIPAAVFVLGTLVRAGINAPRPYEQPGFIPLISKNKTGHACPSRHLLSVSVIAVIWWQCAPMISIGLFLLAVMIAALRVTAGVHSLRDVVMGMIFGSLCGSIGMWLFYEQTAWFR